jgi:serine/threonine-protein kinase PRP4
MHNLMRHYPEAERRKVTQLADLLDKMFNFDPEKRITVSQALAHPFIKERRCRLTPMLSPG